MKDQDRKQEMEGERGRGRRRERGKQKRGEVPVKLLGVTAARAARAWEPW